MTAGLLAIWPHLLMVIATGVYGCWLHGKFGHNSKDETAWNLSLVGAIWCGFWFITLPLLVWAHFRYRRETTS